ncbi:MAG: guanylate kinase [Parvibaculales bacterium]
MLVLSSPSGAGKTSLCRELLQRDKKIILSVSVTTRPKREAEEQNRDYVFVSEESFATMKAEGQFLEQACVFGNYYATPKKPIEAALSKGLDVLFDIDWQGTQQLQEGSPKNLVRVFVLPPSVVALKQRLESRAQDAKEVVEDRMRKAHDEISHYAEYDYIIINDDFEKSIEELHAILIAERLKRSRQEGLSDFVNNLRKKL